MKIIIAVLSIVVAVLALALWKQDTSVRASVETADAALAAVSNRLVEASMKLTHQEQLAAVAKAGLEERARELVSLSNIVATLRANLDQARADGGAAQARAQSFEARAAAAEARSAGLMAKVEQLGAEKQDLKVELEQSRGRAERVESARFALANEAESLKIEKFELARQWNDPRALRLQLQRLKSGAPPLQWLPNSSVGLSDTPTTSAVDLGSEGHR
jgi:chromosome segregation ATPase